MFSCTLYNTLRNNFFDETIYIKQILLFFNDLDVKSNILFPFKDIDPFICKSVAAFIFEMTLSRNFQSELTN